MPLKILDDYITSIKVKKHTIHLFEHAKLLTFSSILRWGDNFDLCFLCHFWTKYRCFCAHWKGNFLIFSKITQLYLLFTPKGPIEHSNKNITFEGMLCRSYKGAPRYVNCTYYQMDHIL